MSTAVRACASASRTASATAAAAATTPFESSSRRSSHVMTSSGLFGDGDDISTNRADAEVRNINSFYSPIAGSSSSREDDSPTSVAFEPHLQIFVPDRNDPIEESLRRKCAFYFMNPIEKFLARRQAPWKLILQFAKIILITAQLLVFGQFRYAHTNYYKDNHITFEHLFLKNWDSVREINAYPPATGKFALYKKNTFYSYFDYTASTYADLDDVTIVPTLRNSTLDFCIEAYAPKVNGNKGHYVNFEEAYLQIAANKDVATKRCLSIKNESLPNFNSQEYLEKHDFQVPWDSLLEMHINFTVNTVTSRQLGPLVGPECFNFHIEIVFDNRDHDGQIPIVMNSVPRRIECPITSLEQTNEVYTIRTLSAVVAIVCFISFVLCCRALMRGQLLARETSNFFEARYKVKLSRCELMQFLNLWYVVICVNDILIIIGTVLKELIEARRTNSDLWDFCSTFLGVGNLLVWLGMLRYLGFFDKYNTIMLTLQQALPNIIRFTICVSIMYLGFVFCGWVVLGPYQFKFYTLSSTSECLFSLINGDDMFATFSMVSSKSNMIWFFSRVYLYLFVIIFIYVVLSLFIAIIMDAYEVVKEHYKMGFPRSRIDDFAKGVKYDPYSKMFCEGTSPSLLYRFWAWIMINRYGSQWKGYPRDMGRDITMGGRSEEALDELTPLLT